MLYNVSIFIFVINNVYIYIYIYILTYVCIEFVNVCCRFEFRHPQEGPQKAQKDPISGCEMRVRHLQTHLQDQGLAAGHEFGFPVTKLRIFIYQTAGCCAVLHN